MAVKTKQQIIDDATALIPDNTNHEVSPADIRQRIIDVVDSSLFTEELPDFATVATTGSYNDLTNKPTYATVANTGSYNDLTNKPVYANVATTGQYVDLINKPVLATVATSGAYSDLTGKPTLGALAPKDQVAVSDILISNTSSTFVLGRASTTGSLISIPYSISTDANTLVMRGTNGQVQVGNPTSDLHAVPRSYVNANAVLVNAAQTLTANQQSQARGNINTDLLVTNRNKFINGKLEFWQRASTQNATGYRSSDRFAVGAGGTGVAYTWSRSAFGMGDTSIPGNTEVYGTMVITNGGDAANGMVNIYQSVENVRTLAGKQATVTFYAMNPGATALKIALNCYQIFSNSGSPSPRVDTPIGVVTLPGNSTWARYDVVFNVPSITGMTRVGGEDKIGIEFIMSAGSAITRGQGIGIQTGTFNLARFSFVEGDATKELDPFSERPSTLEQLLCWRFYRVIRLQWSGMSTSGVGYWTRDTLYPPMRAIPTSTMVVTAQTGFNTSGSVFVSSETVVVNVVCNSTINNGEYTVDIKLDAET